MEKITYITAKYYDSKGNLVRKELWTVPEFQQMCHDLQAARVSTIYLYHPIKKEAKQFNVSDFVSTQKKPVQPIRPVRACPDCGARDFTISISHALRCKNYLSIW